MLKIKEMLHAAASVGNASEGYILTDVSKALETWEEQGGHFLWLCNEIESVYFIALDDTPITSFVEATMTEVMPMDEVYEKHPSSTFVMNTDTFHAVTEEEARN